MRGKEKQHRNIDRAFCDRSVPLVALGELSTAETIDCHCSPSAIDNVDRRVQLVHRSFSLNEFVEPSGSQATCRRVVTDQIARHPHVPESPFEETFGRLAKIK